MDGEGPVEIRDLAADDEAEFVAAIAAMRTSDPTMEFALAWRPEIPFAEYRRRLAEQREGRELPEGWLPHTLRFAFCGRRLAGRVSIRHRLSERSAVVGGHIGFATVAEFRRRGVATAMLRHALAECARVGIASALVTCDDDNVGSVGVIAACGGVLEDVVTVAGQRKRRYWLAT